MSSDEALWRTYSQVYDGVLKIIPYRNLLLEVVDSAHIEPGMRVLDACSGTGNLLWALQERGIKCSVTAIDSSEAMSKKALPKVEKYDGEVEPIYANLDAPVEEWKTTGPFDRIVLNNALCLLAHPAEALKKFATVAAPGAILVASTPRPNPDIQELLDDHLQLAEAAGITKEEALQQLVPLLPPLLKCNEMLMARYGDSYHLPSEAQLRGWFEGSGWNLTDVRLTYAGQNWLVVATKP